MGVEYQLLWVVVWLFRAFVFLVAAWGVFHYSTFGSGRTRVGLLRAVVLVGTLVVFCLDLPAIFSVVAAIVFVTTLFVPSEPKKPRRRWA